MKTRIDAHTCGCVAAVFSACVLTATAQTLTWNPGGPSNNWSTAAGDENWEPGPVAWQPNADAYFNSTAESVTVTTAVTFNDLVFDTGGHLIADGAGSLALGNDLASTIAVTNAPDTVSIVEIIANNAGGPSQLVKEGAGTLVLGGLNTFTGGVAINAGTLALTNSNQLPAANAIVIGADGKLSTNSGGVTFANTISGSGRLDIASTAEVGYNGDWSGFTGTANVLTSVGGKLNTAGGNFVPPAPEAVINVTNGATLFTSGNKVFTNSFTVLGTGNTENRGALRLDTGVTIAGAITLLGNATLGNSGSSAATVSGVIGDGGNGFGIRTAATGAQTIVLAGPNTFTGRATLAGQTVFSVSQINNSGEDGNLGRNSTIDFGNATTGGALVYTGPGETTDRVLNLAGTTGGAALTHNGSGPLKFTSDQTATGAGSKTLTLQGTGNIEIAGAIVDNSSANTTILTKAGSGTLKLSGASTFSGAVNLNGGSLVVAHPSALGADDTIAPNRLVTCGAGAANAAPVTLDLASDTGIGSYRFWGSSNNEVTLVSNRATSGAGITHVFAANSGIGNNSCNFTAGPNVASGTAGVAFTSLSVAAGGAGTGTLNPTTAPVTILGMVSIAHNNAAKTLNLGGTHTGNSILGTVADGLNVLSLAKSNTGTWTIAGDRTYTGTTTVNGGTLVLTGASVVTGATTVNGGQVIYRGDHSGVTAAGAATVLNGGKLELDYSVHDSSKLSNFANLTLAGGTLELTGGSHPEIVGSTTLAGGSGCLVTRSDGSAVLHLNTITAAGGGRLHFAAEGLATTDNLNTNGILGAWATIESGGESHWAVNSTGAADGPITAYTGYFDIARLGSSIPDSPTANIRIIEAGVSGDIIAGGGALTTFNTLLMAADGGPATIATDAPGDLLRIGGETGGGIWLQAGAGDLIIGTSPNGGVLTTGGTPNSVAATLNLITENPDAGLVINATIANNGSDVVGLAKSGPGGLALNGTNTFTGAVSLGGGTTRLGNAAGLGINTAVSLASDARLDLNGTSPVLGSLAAAATTLITDNATGAGTSTLAVTGALGAALSGRFADGPERSLRLVLRNNNAGHTVLDNSANSFSGGLVLAHTSSGTRLVTGTIPPAAGSPGALVSGRYGTGPIIVGESAADKAGIFAQANNQTLPNDIVSNTALGTDRVGTFRVDATGFTLPGTLTANLAPMTFSTNGTGALTATGRITGPNGLTLLSHTLGGTSLTVTLANTGTANDYAGNTVINQNAQAGRSYTLALGAPEQIPHGPGKGNVTINTNGTGAGTLQLAGHNETINGLNGTGTVTTNAGTPVLTIGETDAASDFTGVISGNLALVKTGSGALTLGGTVASTYTGPTTLNGGLITAGKGSAFGAAGAASGTIVNPGASVNTNGQNFGSEQFTLAGGTIRNDGAADQTNTMQRLNVTASSTVGGTRRWDVRGGTLGGLTVAAGTTLAKVDANLVAVVQNPAVIDGLIRVDAGQFGLHYAVNMTGSGSVEVQAGAEFQIGSYGAASVVGVPVSVADGTLAGLNDGGGLSRFDGPVTVVAGTTATLRADQGFTINGQLGGGGAIRKTGGGTLTFNTAPVHTGDTTIDAGTLVVTTPSTFADSAAIRIAATATLNLAAPGSDAVAAFFIDGVEQVQGVWGSTGSGVANETARITGPGLLVVGAAPADPYAAWADARGLTPGINDGPGQDPDGDGQVNLAEFAFDGDPLNAIGDGKIVAKIAELGGQPALVLTLPVRAGASFADAGGPEQSATIDGVVYVIEGSDSDLVLWELDVTEVTGPDALAIQAGLPPLSDLDEDTSPTTPTAPSAHPARSPAIPPISSAPSSRSPPPPDPACPSSTPTPTVIQ
jgi:autotransporter-associated beta strand protein